MTSPAETVQTPPYAAWSTFTTFLDSLKNTAVPPAIDTSVMMRMSGSAQTQVRGALRFFSLIDDSGAVAPELRDLVAAYGTENWKDVWGIVFFGEGYRQIVGELDIDRATLKQLVDRFRENGGVNGAMLRKAVRFYLDALAATGVTFSPHFKARGLSIVTGERGPKARGNGKPNAATKDATPEPARRTMRAAGEHDLLVQLPGREPLMIPLPPDLTADEWNFINAHVTAYMTLRNKKQ